MVKRETGRKLKCLRSDNGSEYTSREFETYYIKNGIRNEKTFLALHNIMVWLKGWIAPSLRGLGVY